MSAPPGYGELPFGWRTFNTDAILPPHGLEEIVRIASSMAVTHELAPTSVTSREADRRPIPLSSLDGLAVDQALPWLRPLYLGPFRERVQSTTPEPVLTAQDRRSSLVINVQRGDHQRGYECHVDSTPFSTLLQATTHPPGAGGELVVANRGDVLGREAVDADASRIYPVAGRFIMFDGRGHTYYVRPLTNPNDVRVAVVMNYYTPSVTEADRPDDLDGHLFYSNT
jgi:hypothetical protein